MGRRRACPAGALPLPAALAYRRHHDQLRRHWRFGGRACRPLRRVPAAGPGPPPLADRRAHRPGPQGHAVGVPRRCRTQAATRVQAHPRLGAGPGRHALPAAADPAPRCGRRRLSDLLHRHPRTVLGRADRRLPGHLDCRCRRGRALSRRRPQGAGRPLRNRRHRDEPRGRCAQCAAHERPRPSGRLVRPFHDHLPRLRRRGAGARADPARSGRAGAGRRRAAAPPPVVAAGLAARQARRHAVLQRPGVCAVGQGCVPSGRGRRDRRHAVRAVVPAWPRGGTGAAGTRPLPARPRRCRGRHRRRRPRACAERVGRPRRRRPEDDAPEADEDIDADADVEQVADAADTPPEALEADVEPGDDAEAEQDVDSAIADETDSDDSDDTTKPA